MFLLLASKSPRRRKLISKLGWEVRVVDINVDETLEEGCPASEAAERISLLKAAGYPVNNLRDDEVLVTADTVVALDGEALGKPRDEADAVAMLHRLSGRWHTVYSGVTLTWPCGSRSFTEATKVHFRELADAEITHYVRQYRPLDKAGAYGIQEWIGMIGIDRIEGCYYNVMGLPLARLYKELTSIPGLS